MSRNLLAKHKLEAFKAWLDLKEIVYRDPRGDYQVLQIQMSNGQWQCIFDRHSALEHYTVAAPLEGLVRKFIQETRK